jgi:hypothetical protein
MPDPHDNELKNEQSKSKSSLDEALIKTGDGHTAKESGLLVTLGKIAGIGGISVGVLFLLFLNFIRQKFLPNLEPAQGYNLLLLFMLFTFGIASAGLAVWASQVKAGRFVVVLLLSFTLAMSALGAYLVHGAKEDLKTNGAQSTTNYVAPESVRIQQRKDAQDAFDLSYKRFRLGAESVQTLIGAHQRLIETELTLCETHQDRIAVYREALATATAVETEVQHDIALGTMAPGEIYVVRMHHTETEISLAKEQSALPAK